MLHLNLAFLHFFSHLWSFTLLLFRAAGWVESHAFYKLRNILLLKKNLSPTSSSAKGFTLEEPYLTNSGRFTVAGLNQLGLCTVGEVRLSLHIDHMLHVLTWECLALQNLLGQPGPLLTSGQGFRRPLDLGGVGNSLLVDRGLSQPASPCHCARHLGPWEARRAGGETARRRPRPPTKDDLHKVVAVGRGGGWGLYLVCVNVGLTSEMIWCDDVGEKNSSAFPETTALTKSQRLSITSSQFHPFHRFYFGKFTTGYFQTKRLSWLHHNSQHNASSNVRSWAPLSSRS